MACTITNSKGDVMESFINGKTSHLDLIKMARDGVVYFQDNDSDLTIMPVSKIPRNYLPDAKCKIKKRDIVDYDAIADAINL